MSTYQSRFDAKGRMSIPAPYRTVLRAGTDGASAKLVLRPSERHACIDAWPEPAFDELAERIELLPQMSEDEEDVSTTLYATAWTVEPDKEGRITVPDSLVRHAGLTQSVTFLGRGKFFQIWTPEGADQRMTDAARAVVVRKITLPAAAPR